MARIAGVDLPKNERIVIGLTRIYGIGKTLSEKILNEAQIDTNIRVKDMSDDMVLKIRNILDRDYKVEGEKKKEVSLNIKRLLEIGSYRGTRHKMGLPVRGQRTCTNARTRKGPKKVAIKKKGGK